MYRRAYPTCGWKPALFNNHKNAHLLFYVYFSRAENIIKNTFSIKFYFSPVRMS